MLKHKDIPNRVIETAKSVYTAEIYKGQATSKEYHDAMLAAITAALNEWSEMKVVTEYYLNTGDYFEPAIILPLSNKEGY